MIGNGGVFSYTLWSPVETGPKSHDLTQRNQSAFLIESDGISQVAGLA